MLISFREWLTRQARDRGAIGDIAREVGADKCLPRDAQSYAAIKAHILAAHGASDGAKQALRLAAAEWEYVEPGGDLHSSGAAQTWVLVANMHEWMCKRSISAF